LSLEYFTYGLENKKMFLSDCPSYIVHVPFPAVINPTSRK